MGNVILILLWRDIDNDGNMILMEGPALQDEKVWKKFLGKDIKIKG